MSSSFMNTPVIRAPAETPLRRASKVKRALTSGVSAALPPEKTRDPIRQGYIICILDLASSFLLQGMDDEQSSGQVIGSTTQTCRPDPGTG